MCNNKKFYKALLKEPYMKSQYTGMIFEIGKTYNIPDGVRVQMYNHGFHYTDNIYLLPLWYTPNTYYIFEVVPNGDIKYDELESKYCSQELTIVKQLDDDEIEKLYKENRNNVIYNENPYYRKSAVRLGRPDDLKVLMNDKHPIVKMELIKMGYDNKSNITNIIQYMKQLYRK